MTIKVLFFAAFREQLGCDSLTLDYVDNITISELQQQLSHRGDQWQKVFSNTALLSAVNHTMVDVEHEINDLDEVAFFPPVTGG